MKQYIGSKEHFEDEVNAYYDAKQQHDKEQIDNRQQPDERTDKCAFKGCNEIGYMGGYCHYHFYSKK